MANLRISRGALAELQRRHLSFLEERLVSARAREDWIRSAEADAEAVREVPIRDILQPRELAGNLHRALGSAAIGTFFAPLAARLQRAAIGGLREDGTKLGEYVPEEARLAIEDILAGPDLVPDALVRELFGQKAIEDAIHDTLLEGLTQFNRTVNPFFAEWGIPSLLRRVPLGGGLILASMEALRGEFDRRLEPEMRRFLAPFSRRATAQMAELFLANRDEPRFVELRRNLVTFLWSRSLSELLAGADAEALDLGAFAAERIAIALLERDEATGELARLLGRFVEDLGDVTVGQWLHEIGASGRPDAGAWAELLWPQVEAVLRSRLVRDFLREITAEFYEGLAQG